MLGCFLAGIACVVAGVVLGWRMGYGVGYMDGQYCPNSRASFTPWPWNYPEV